MADPTVTGGVIGGVIVATCWGISKVIPAVAKVVKSNGKNSGKNNTLTSIECKPGKAKICIDRGEKLCTRSVQAVERTRAYERFDAFLIDKT